MAKKERITINVDPDDYKRIQRAAGLRRKSVSEYALTLVEKGIGEEFLTQKMNELEVLFSNQTDDKSDHLFKLLGPVILEILLTLRLKNTITPEESEKIKQLSSASFEKLISQKV